MLRQKRFLSILTIAAVSAGLFCGTPQTVQAAGVNVETHSQKEIARYLHETDASVKDSIIYKKEPSLKSNLEAGVLSEETQAKGIAMVNQLRFVAGLGEVTLDTDAIKAMQAAALVSAANGSLSHSPKQPSGMSEELFEAGLQGAGSANLSFGRGSINRAILAGWMGENSSAGSLAGVGHRRWILNPRMTKTAFGAVGSYCSMYIFDRSGHSKASGVVWPAQQMPLEYFTDRDPWSYSFGKVIENTEEVAVQLVKRSTGQTWNFSEEKADGFFAVNNDWYAAPGCVIFRPDDVTYEADDIFDVTITGLPTAVEYSVTFFDVSKVALYDPAQITAQPEDVSVKQGEVASFTVEVTGDVLTYQWQYKNADASEWKDSSIGAAKTPVMAFTVTEDKSLDGRQYRCVISDATGKRVVSDSAALNIK